MGLQLQDSDIFEEFILASQLHGCEEDGYIWEKLLKKGKFLSYNDYDDDVEDIYDEDDDDIKGKDDVSSSIDGGYHSHDDSSSSISDLIEFDIGIRNGGGTEKERCRPIRVSIDSGFGDCSDIDEEEEDDDEDDFEHEEEKKEEKRRNRKNKCVILESYEQGAEDFKGDDEDSDKEEEKKRNWKNKCVMQTFIDSNLESYEQGVKDFEGDDDDSDDDEEKEEKKRNWKNKCVMQSCIGSNLESFGQEFKDFKEEEEEKEREEKKIVVTCVSDNDDDDDDFDDDEEDPGFNDDYLEEEEDESKESILKTMDDGDNENENNEDENDDDDYDDDKKENLKLCDGNGDHVVTLENIEANHNPGCLITEDEVYEYDGEGCHGDAPHLLLDTRANDDEYYDLAVLCAERVTQMTKTYNDIEAVTRLLEEKERDLELAARIGQSLLVKNKDLSSKNETLEEQLTLANEKVNQLRHELSMKDDLLSIYTQDYESDGAGTPVKDKHTFNSTLAQFDHLQKKVKQLEDENFKLTSETAELQLETGDLEAKEHQLVRDVVSELSERNERIHQLEDEIEIKSDVEIRQQEEITNLLSKTITLDNKIKKLTDENESLQQQLRASQTSQKQLTSELVELTDKYHEALGLLHEAHEELKVLRSKQKPRAVRHMFGSYSPYLPSDSLASELENELMKDVQYPEGNSPEARRRRTLKVLETAKVVKRNQHRHHLNVPGSGQSTSGNESCEYESTDHSRRTSGRSSVYGDTESLASSDHGYTADVDSMYGSGSYSNLSLGRPGIPGSNDLETALHLLSASRDGAGDGGDEKLERKDNKAGSDGSLTPTPLRTPESFMSTGSGLSGLSGLSDPLRCSLKRYKMPEKLQIVKPLEGSMTLHQWQRLATPHLGGLLEERPGVQIKGEKKLDVEEEEGYTLSDYEEDDDFNPGKRYESTGGTYTYTTAKILHPSDDYVANTQTTSCRESTRPAVRSTPNPHLYHGTSTYSMSLGLATILHERGIGARPPVLRRTDSNIFPLPSNPIRFPSIVTETMYDSTKNHSQSIYTSSQNFSRIGFGINSQSSIMENPIQNETPNIVEKIKDIGVTRILTTQASSDSIANSSIMSVPGAIGTGHLEPPVAPSFGVMPESAIYNLPPVLNPLAGSSYMSPPSHNAYGGGAMGMPPVSMTSLSTVTMTSNSMSSIPSLGVDFLKSLKSLQQDDASSTTSTETSSSASLLDTMAPPLRQMVQKPRASDMGLLGIVAPEIENTGLVERARVSEDEVANTSASVIDNMAAPLRKMVQKPTGSQLGLGGLLDPNPDKVGLLERAKAVREKKRPKT